MQKQWNLLLIAGSGILLGAAIGLVGGASPGKSEAAPASSEACAPYLLTRRPGWTTSGAWRGSELLLADTRTKRLLRYSQTGQWLGDGPEAIESELENFFPNGVRAKRNGFLLELAKGRLMALDEAFVPGEQREVYGMNETGGQKRSFQSLFLWEPIGEEILAFGDLKDAQDQWSSALVRFTLGRSPEFRILLTFSLGHPTRTFYRLGYPYIAALGDTGYVLLMEKNVRLCANRKRGGGLAPLGFDLPGPAVNPVLPVLSTTDAAATMRAVEQSAMYAGLYGWDGYLYLLSRAPEGSAVRWTLTKIHPDKGIIGSAILPTRANHLTVVPGPTAWALVEKGPVRSYGVQTVSSVWMVDSAKIRSLRGHIGKLCPISKNGISRQ